KEAPGRLPLPPEVINLDTRKEGSDKDSNPKLGSSKTKLGVDSLLKICGRMIKKDRSGSTNKFHENLMRIPITSMEKYLKTEKLSPKTVLNNKTLKTAIAYLIAEAELLFSVVKQKSSQSLIRLLNEQAILLMNQLSRQNISTYLR
ncbi:uncharacterized protein VP01_7616g1, partial [Puccinia sorghi]